MQRAVLASLALVALVHAAPITEPTKTTEDSAGDATTGIIIPKPTFILLPPITGPIKPSDKRDTEVKERQFTWGDPSTWWGVGGEQPPTPTPTDGSTIGTPITGGMNPSNKRQTIIGGEDATKAKIVALELEYETLLHTFGTNGPKPIQNRLAAIKDELLHKYGITIVQSPDGTTTTFTPGKRDFTFPGGPLPGGPLIPENPIPGGPIEPSD
ncbi:hypothetical protein F4859DRAFT_196947 [Xylaria cf. heliscus]|nr:hypothetical protein F4859DRAFT_196947 [Xylaria cf. heliscus]